MNLNPEDLKALNREILLGFWKVHILHHAAEGPVVGQWLLKELRRHGYDVSPGTLYPMLQRMEGNGWLRSEVDPKRGPRAPRKYYLTEKGGEVLALIGRQVAELNKEIGGADSPSKAAEEKKKDE
ncbi:MAG TPA: PadR family transcriptional regulator [Desulfuromonadales bacterium]|nr:PadR family transcriptional regulator [Desulfuromonadales bacterium]